MSRIETYLDAGYVPTPPALLSAIAAQVAPSANPRAMLADFFCGQGEAAAAIGEALGVSYTLGVEIHKERAEAARQRLDRVICEDSLSGIMGSHGVFDVCFHNPPYAQNLQGDSAKYKRLEYQASLCVSPYIRPDGLLIAVLPGHRVTGETRFIDLFSNHYDVLRVFAFPPGYFEAYRQVVIYARRRLLPRTDGGGREFARILRDGAPPLPETCPPGERIALPDTPITKRWFYRGRELEVDLMAKEVAACEWSGARRFDAMLRPPEQTRIGYPAMPLKKTHIGSMIAASVLNNALLRRGRELNLIVARNPKRQKEKVVENNRDDESQRVPVRVTEEFATECVAFNPRTGVFQQFSAGEPEAFYAYIQRWLDPLVENILTNFPPLYTFNFRETFPQWAVEYIDHYVATRAEIPGRARRGLFEGQKHVVAAMFLKFLEQLPGTHRQRGFFLLGGQTGMGKAQPLDAKILTPTGWKRMGDVHVGDQVIGANGRPTNVIAVFPQGEKDIFRVTFTDGASTECCKEHLWLVRSSWGKWAGRPPVVRTLEQLCQNISDVNGKLHHYIPLVKPVEFVESELPLDPYLLGLLIGDGGYTGDGVILTTADKEIRAAAERMLPVGLTVQPRSGYSYAISSGTGGRAGRNAVTNALSALGLRGKRSEAKFVPDAYKFASSATRIALLQGLLDTDGSVGCQPGSTLEFSTASERLAMDVVFLVQSLGGTATVRSRVPHYTYRGERRDGRLSYRIHFTLPLNVAPFRLTRKLAAYRPPTKYLPTRAITLVEPVGRKAAQCIAVDAPDQLYVTDDFIVTHNTFSAIALMGLFARLWAVETGHLASAPGWPYFLFVTEPTLLEQMRDEVKKGDPLLRPKIVTDVAEVSAFLAEAETTPWPMVLITSRTALKDGCGTAPGVVERRYHYRDRDTGQINSEPRFHCPACGAVQTEEVKEDEEWLELPVTDISYFQNSYRTCVACGGALWQQARQFGHSGYRASYAECATHWSAAADLRGGEPEPMPRIAAAVSQTRVLEAGEAEFKLETGDQLVLYDSMLVVRRGVPVVAALDTRAWTLTTDRAALARWPHRLSQRPLPAGTRLWQVPSPKKALLNPPPARLAVVEHLRRLAKHGHLVVGRDGHPVRQRVKALLGVVDELHTYKAEDSNAGAALAHLVEAAHKIVGLTATPYGGYASNLFGIEYRTNPEFRRRWPHDGLAEFTRRFGLFDWIERRNRSYASGYQGYGGYSAMSGVARKKERLRELPAASPELVASLLDHYLFVGFADLGIQMVPRTEHPVLVEPEEDFEKAYRAFAGDAASALRTAKDDRVNLAGSIHQALRVYAAAPWRAAHVRDRTGRVWAWGPDLEKVCPNCGRTLFKDAACDCAGEPVEGVKRRRVFARERALLDQLQAAQAAHRASIVYVLHTGELDIVTGRWVGPGSLCETHGIKAVDGRGWASGKRQARMEQAVLSGADAVFINPQRVALGMNLTAFCNCHFYQVADQFALMVQAFARPWRPTQTQPVEGYYHAARGTLEQTVLKRHARKLYAALLVHGDPLQSALFDDEDEADFDLLRQLTELMQDKHVEDLGAMFAQYNAAIEQTTSPAGYIGGYQIEVEARDFEHRERALESRLEAALEVETPALPAELPRSGTQLSLFV